MSNSNNTKSSGIGFGGLLQIVFITLKLMEIITWSWFYVLLPTLIPLFILLIFLLFVGVITLVSIFKK